MANLLGVWRLAKDTADNTLITRTIAAVPGKGLILGRIYVSYEVLPITDNYLTVDWFLNGTEVSIPIGCNVQGPIPIDLYPYVLGDINTPIVLTLSASGAAANIAKLNVFYALNESWP